MAESRIPPAKPAKAAGSADMAKRGEQLTKAITGLNAGARSGPAPRWVHDLVDALWDFFT